MTTPDRLNYVKVPFLRLFNRNDYILDFSTLEFDKFMQASVDTTLCQYCGKSQEASLEKYANSAPRKQVLKLFPTF